MASKLLISISVSGATAARWRGGQLASCTVFGNDDNSIAAFGEFLARYSNTPAYLLVDAVEEDYRFETMPHASASERGQMVERKLRQYYRSTPYSGGMLLGRDSGKRRDDRFLFSALTNPELIEPWLAELNRAGLPVAGIYLLPTVTPALVDLIGVRAPNLLLVAVHPAGIRLTFFKDGVFRLSRLSRADADSGEGRAIIDEISNTRLYLHALRAATLDESVAVVLLDHADRLAGTGAAITAENPSLQCTRLGRADIAARLKLDPALITQSLSTIYLSLLGARTPDTNLAAPAITLGFRRYQARRQLIAAAGITAAVCAVWAGFNILQQLSVSEDINDVARRTARVNAEYQTATLQFPESPTSAENLQKGTELAKKLRDDARTPEQFLAVVGRALEASPQIVLLELGWQYLPGEIAARGDAASQQPVARETTPPGIPGAANQRRQSGLLSGQVRNFGGDFRGAISLISALAERLRADPAVANVSVVKLPLNVSPTIAMTGSTAENPARTGTADFQIVVTLKQNS